MKYLSTIILLIQTIFGSAQWTESSMAHCEDQDFNRKVNKMLNYSVEVVSVDKVYECLSNYYLLDARELEEYIVSHIPGAIHFGYKDPKWEDLDSIDRQKEILVYCSIGYRSEKIGEKLKKRGFTKVQNIYGSIFEWANRGYPLEDPRGNQTKEVHTYNKNWSKWLLNPDYQKIW